MACPTASRRTRCCALRVHRPQAHSPPRRARSRRAPRSSAVVLSATRLCGPSQGVRGTNCDDATTTAWQSEGIAVKSPCLARSLCISGQSLLAAQAPASSLDATAATNGASELSAAASSPNAGTSGRGADAGQSDSALPNVAKESTSAAARSFATASASRAGTPSSPAAGAAAVGGNAGDLSSSPKELAVVVERSRLCARREPGGDGSSRPRQPHGGLRRWLQSDRLFCVEASS